jgi:hypothetical protein
MLNNFFSEYRVVYEIMGKNIVERGSPQVTIMRMRIACLIPNTNTQRFCSVHCFYILHNRCTNAPRCYVIHILPVLFNKRSGPTLELKKLQVSCQKCETNWTLVTGPTVFDIAVIWKHATPYEVTCHLEGNMLKEERGSVTNVTPHWYTSGAEILVCFYCYKLLTADKE